ncbi:MAG: hypothetical protein H6622_13215 [Halobacteriovoraceae bacterium]|nr:hypothetical protein [Halobacteriovoraceae bacterium]
MKKDAGQVKEIREFSIKDLVVESRSMSANVRAEVVKQREQDSKSRSQKNVSQKDFLNSPLTKGRHKGFNSNINFSEFFKTIFKDGFLLEDFQYPETKRGTDEAYFLTILSSSRLASFANEEYTPIMVLSLSSRRNTSNVIYLCAKIEKSGIFLPFARQKAKDNRDVGLSKVVHGRTDVTTKDANEWVRDMEANSFKLVSVMKAFRELKLTNEQMEDIARDAYFWRISITNGAYPIKDEWKKMLKPNYNSSKVNTALGLYINIMEKLFSPIYYEDFEYASKKHTGEMVLKRIQVPCKIDRRYLIIAKEISSRFFHILDKADVVKRTANFVLKK